VKQIKQQPSGISITKLQTNNSSGYYNMDSLPVTNKTLGEPESATNKTLETGAAMVQVCFLLYTYTYNQR